MSCVLFALVAEDAGGRKPPDQTEAGASGRGRRLYLDGRHQPAHQLQAPPARPSGGVIEVVRPGSTGHPVEAVEARSLGRPPRSGSGPAAGRLGRRSPGHGRRGRRAGTRCCTPRPWPGCRRRRSRGASRTPAGRTPRAARVAPMSRDSAGNLRSRDSRMADTPSRRRQRDTQHGDDRNPAHAGHRRPRTGRSDESGGATGRARRQPVPVRHVVVGRSGPGAPRGLLSPQDDDGQRAAGVLLLPAAPGRDRHDVPFSPHPRPGPPMGRPHAGRVLLRRSGVVAAHRGADASRLPVGGPPGRGAARDPPPPPPVLRPLGGRRHRGVLAALRARLAAAAHRGPPWGRDPAVPVVVHTQGRDPVGAGRGPPATGRLPGGGRLPQPEMAGRAGVRGHAGMAGGPRHRVRLHRRAHGGRPPLDAAGHGGDVVDRRGALRRSARPSPRIRGPGPTATATASWPTPPSRPASWQGRPARST